jgi:hypothetical protein
MRKARLLPLSIVMAVAVAAAPVHALWAETPLMLSGDSGEADVGDRLVFRITPATPAQAARWGSQTIAVAWVPVEDSGAGRSILASLDLDEEAQGTFAWEVPAEASDLNVFVILVSDAEQLAQHYVRVGNAEPMAFLMGGGPVDGSPRGDEDKPAASAARAGPLALFALLALAAVASLRPRT